MIERGLLYFLPGPTSITRERIEAAGLGYLFDGRGGPGPSFAGVTSGPSGEGGVYFVVPGRSGRGAPSLSAINGAKWNQIAGTAAWLGVLEDALPGPEDLARSEMFDGHEVELADGARWLVPVVRLLGGDTRLPRALQWNGQDWTRGEVIPAYRKLFAAGLRIWDAVSGSLEAGSVTLSEEATTAASALALNYRLGPAEVSALGLLTTRTEVSVLKALVDLPALEAIRGKAEAASP